MRNTIVEGFWRTAAAALMGIVSTGIAAWLLVGQKAVGREEVMQMIAAESPYVADRRAIEERLDQNNRLLTRLVSDVSEIKIEQARLIERVEALAVNANPPLPIRRDR